MTRRVKVGNVNIGGGAPVSIQTMLDIPSYDIEGNVKQACQVEQAGCEILRIAVPDVAALSTFEAVKKSISIPLVADIHFDYKLALGAIDAGADKVRINPGNIGSEDRVRAVVDKCKEYSVPIRIGVNAGSIEKSILSKYGSATPDALCDSALNEIKILESMDFKDIVVSIKTSSPQDTVSAYRKISGLIDYPLHIGVTESGTIKSGTVKSAAALGTLLFEGIGDTMRVSLTDSPVNEVKTGIEILKACGMRKGPEVVSCPTCGRTRIDVKTLASQVESMISGLNKPIKVAVMGCVVNGPGESRDADIGITGGNGEGIIFIKGEIVEKVKENELLTTLDEYIKDLCK